MSDYISRQAAIETIRNLDDYTCTQKAVILGDAMNVIAKLPSADVQPHQLTEEDLTELRHRFGNKVERVVRDMISGKEERWMT